LPGHGRTNKRTDNQGAMATVLIRIARRIPAYVTTQ
jgi:hypothetical protein